MRGVAQSIDGLSQSMGTQLQTQRYNERLGMETLTSLTNNATQMLPTLGMGAVGMQAANWGARLSAAVKGAPGWAVAACSKTPLNQPGPPFSAAPGADSSSKGRLAATRSAHSACARPCTTKAGSLRNAFTIDPKALACQAFRKRIALRSCGAKASGEA
jgi:hypothetical protein